MKTPFYKLMLLTNRQGIAVDDYLQFIKVCAVSGVTAVQLREKQQTPEFLLMFGQKLKEILDPLAIPLIINDDIALALKLDAAGVHLGQSDGDPVLARKLLGPAKIIGVSIDSIDNLVSANQLTIDYVGISAIFATVNKANVKTTWGLDGLQQIAALSKHPMVGIGGITALNTAAVLAHGADGIAVIGAVHEAPNPAKATQRLRHIIDEGDNGEC